MRRREFITGFGCAAALPFATQAQQPGRIYRIGFLIPVPRQVLAAFFEELRLGGFVEGQNLVVIPGGFDVREDQINEHAAVLVKAAPDAVVCGPAPYIRVLQQITKAIPLVAGSEDMVAEGLVASLARPGGNITGVSILSPELDEKRLGLLMEAVPSARRIAALYDAKNTKQSHVQILQNTARKRGVEIVAVAVSRPEETLAAINAAKSSDAQAIDFLATPLFTVNKQSVYERIAELRLPAMYQWPEMAEEGGFMAYGSRLSQMNVQRGRILVKLLRGAKPADIPVEQPTVFQLAINLRTAKAIGHEVPAGLVLRADKVIE